MKNWFENCRLNIITIMMKNSARNKKEFEEMLPIVERFGSKSKVIDLLLIVGELFWRPGAP
jgi:hypothetical protein